LVRPQIVGLASGLIQFDNFTYTPKKFGLKYLILLASKIPDWSVPQIPDASKSL
jgi:hypothetical protein